jgi:hypothetical protein
MSELNKAPQFVRLSAQAATAELRTETYQGSEVVVVPVIALLGNVVVEGMVSEAPEFVPADVLAAAPSGWDGRPILAAHPNNGTSGANEPSTWDTRVFGQIFHSEFSDNRLRVEAWLNPAQAERAGDDAVDVLARVQSGEMVEVSVGAWVWLEDAEGVSPDGKPYKQVWQACVPDHLAMGLTTQGGVGACSNKMGCGGPRVFASNGGPRVYSAKQATEIKESNMNTSLLARLVAKLGADGLTALAEGMSDNQLRQKLNKALRAIVPAFWGVEEVFHESSTAIYVAMPGDSIEFYECSFTVDGDNVTLGRRKRVEPVTEWKKVATAQGAGDDSKDEADNKPAANAGCKCHEAAAIADGEAARKGKGDGMTDKVKELVGRLTANAATKLTDADVDKLSALGEEQLTALVALVEKPPVEVVKEVVKESTPDPNLVTLTKDEATAMRRALAREQEREKVHRANLTKALVDSGVCKYTEAQLAKKETDDLELLAESLGLLNAEDAGVVDFSGRSLLAASAADDKDNASAAPPDAWKLDANVSKAIGHRTIQ